MSIYTEFYLNSKSSTVQLETLEIYHPNFSQRYFLVRNAVQGFDGVLETGQEESFVYLPMRITYLGARGNLDQSFKVDLGDVGEILAKELDNVQAADGFGVVPVVKYRTYRSDDVSRPMFGPLVLQCGPLSFNKEGVSFEARAPRLNNNTTGEQYKIDRFPMLRGWL